MRFLGRSVRSNIDHVRFVSSFHDLVGRWGAALLSGTKMASSTSFHPPITMTTRGDLGPWVDIRLLPGFRLVAWSVCAGRNSPSEARHRVRSVNTTVRQKNEGDEVKETINIESPSDSGSILFGTLGVHKHES
jgi:hypothetical protein